jgi:hypothetical protein
VDKYNSYDKVVKESFSLFKNRSLEFLDNDLESEIEDLLSVEVTKTTTKKAYADFAYRLKGGKGLHIEWEVDISRDDMRRFASYHIELDDKYDMPFISVIVTAKKPRYAEYITPSMTFKPRIVNLSERNADETIERIKDKIAKGEAVNELEIIYLPLYSSPSGKSLAELVSTSIKLTESMSSSNEEKIISLLFLLTATDLTNAEMSMIWEANIVILEKNNAIRFFEGKGEERKAAETALELLKRGFSPLDIADIVKMPLTWVEGLAAATKI